MTKRVMSGLRGRTMTAIGLALALAACGGGGGGGSTSRPLPTPTPTPSPTPTPTPTPTPAPTPSPTTVNAAEYAASDAAQQANALAAYEEGWTGEGVGIAIIDTGLNGNLAEFAGRVSAASDDVVGDRGFADEDGHGTGVTAIAAAAANGIDMLGVAHGATIVALRADYLDSCAGTEGCEFYDSDLTRAVNAAIEANVAVINMSLGGDSMGDSLLFAVQRAVDAGIVVVLAAGNESEANPTNFSFRGALETTGGGVVIAGSVGTAGDPNAISDFSNRAGIGADYYMVARGYRVQAPDHTGAQFLWSGTSFSAPAISGAVALLAQAFPGLTGAEIVEILFSSADDLGATGVDAIYGHGELNIAAAFAPIGTTSVAGTRTSISLVDNGELPAAAGDAAQGVMSTIVTDRYDRAYRFDINSSLKRAADREPLRRSLSATGLRHRALDMGGVSLSLSMDDRERRLDVNGVFDQMGRDDREKAKLVAGSVIAALDKDTKAALGFSESAYRMASQMADMDTGAFLVARGVAGEVGITASPDRSLAVRRDLGPVALTLSSESGAHFSRLADDGFEARYRLDAVSLDRPTFAGGHVRLGLSMLDERETLLGGRLSAALGDDGSGAQTRFVDLALAQPLGNGVTLGLSARRGDTVFGGGRFKTGAYALDLAKRHVWHDRDQIGVRVSQPLRIESGGLDLLLPQSWDWQTESATMGLQRLSLAPSGRELVGEVAYGRPWLGGRFDLNAYYRRQPGHVAAADGDIGAAIRFSLGL